MVDNTIYKLKFPEIVPFVFKVQVSDWWIRVLGLERVGLRWIKINIILDIWTIIDSKTAYLYDLISFWLSDELSKPLPSSNKNPSNAVKWLGRHCPTLPTCLLCLTNALITVLLSIHTKHSIMKYTIESEGSASEGSGLSFS